MPHPILCPCKRLVRAVQRILHTHPDCTPNTYLCSVCIDNKQYRLTNTFTRNLMRHACTLFGGKATFGFSASEIGNKSLRSGAAMTLFIQNHSTAKIMILGRWSSDAFLVYIRPQVLEWCANMSESMISLDSFTDLGTSDLAAPSDPRTRKRLSSLNGRHTNMDMNMPSFNIHDCENGIPIHEGE